MNLLLHQPLSEFFMTCPVDGIENEQMQVLWKLFGAAPMSVGQKGLNFRLILARFSPSFQEELSLPVWPNNCPKSVSSISIHLNGSLQSAPVRMYSYVWKAVNGKQAFCLHKTLPGLVNTSAEKNIRRVRIYKMKKLWSQFFFCLNEAKTTVISSVMKRTNP